MKNRVNTGTVMLGGGMSHINECRNKVYHGIKFRVGIISELFVLLFLI